MGVVSLRQHGSFRKTDEFLSYITSGKYIRKIRRIADRGVERLKEYTPKDSGLTAESWSYDIEETKQGLRINWNNSNLNRGIPVAMLIQFGHGTGSGVYIEGVDYINPALRPIFDEIGLRIWEEVKRSGK